MSARAVFAVALCALAAVASAADVQLKVLRAPSDMVFTSSESTIAADDAPFLFAHMAGVATVTKQPKVNTLGVLPSVHPLTKPVATLTAVVAGAAATADIEPTVATMLMTVPNRLTYAEQVSYILGGTKRDSTHSLLSGVATTQSYIVSMSASSALLAATSVRADLAGSQHIALLLDPSLREVRLQTTTNELAEALVAGINSELRRADGAASRLEIEEFAAKALVDVLDSRSEFGQDDEVDMVFVTFEAAKDTAAETSASLRDLAAEFATAFGGNAVVQALFLPTASAEAAVHTDARRATPADVVLTYTCYPSEAVCNNSTLLCTSAFNSTDGTNTTHGTCQNFGTEEAVCYRCLCASGYTGEVCQYYDRVHQFSTIVFVSIVLMVVAITVVVALTSIDSGTETILYRTATRTKKTQ